MMSAGKIVLLITVVLNISVPCFGAGLFLMPTTFWNSAPKSNQFQYSEPKETKVPESIEDQIEEPIAYELKMEKPLEGTVCICHFNFGATKALSGLFNLACRK